MALVFTSYGGRVISITYFEKKRKFWFVIFGVLSLNDPTVHITLDGTSHPPPYKTLSEMLTSLREKKNICTKPHTHFSEIKICRYSVMKLNRKSDSVKKINKSNNTDSDMGLTIK